MYLVVVGKMGCCPLVGTALKNISHQEITNYHYLNYIVSIIEYSGIKKRVKLTNLGPFLKLLHYLTRKCSGLKISRFIHNIKRQGLASPEEMCYDEWILIVRGTCS